MLCHQHIGWKEHLETTSGKSFKNIRKSMGPRIEPCGTPLVMLAWQTLWQLAENVLISTVSSLFRIPKEESLNMVVDRVKCFAEINQNSSNMLTSIEDNFPVIYFLQENILCTMCRTKARLVWCIVDDVLVTQIL